MTINIEEGAWAAIWSLAATKLGPKSSETDVGVALVEAIKQYKAAVGVLPDRLRPDLGEAPDKLHIRADGRVIASV